MNHHDIGLTDRLMMLPVAQIGHESQGRPVSLAVTTLH
jgi:hypothetical protein